MSALGTHLILELHGCENSKLNDVEFIRSVLIEAANQANATIVGEVFHEFSPIGVTGVVAIAESHMSIHTWPEHDYAAADIFSCSSKFRLREAEVYIVSALGASEHSTQEIVRGQFAMATTV